MTIGFSKIGHKYPTLLKGIQKQTTFANRGLSTRCKYVPVVKPLSLTRSAVSFYQPIDISKQLHTVTTIGLPRFRAAEVGTYRISIKGVNPLQTNMVVPEGGEATAINAEPTRQRREDVGDLTQIARLLALDYSLETLFLIADQGPLKITNLLEGLGPPEKIIKILSEFRRCDLIEIQDSMVSPTPKAMKITTLLRAKLKNTPS